MPFITEEIWQALPHEGESIMISDFPVYNEELEFDKAEADMKAIMEAISGVRNIRNEMNVPPSKKTKLYIVTEKEEIFSQGKVFFEKLASASEAIVQGTKGGVPENSATVVCSGAELFLPLDELVDKEKELERLSKEKAKLESEIKRVEGKLSNKGFTDKAPAKVVEEERQKGEKYKEMLEKVIKSIESMK